MSAWEGLGVVGTADVERPRPEFPALLTAGYPDDPARGEAVYRRDDSAEILFSGGRLWCGKCNAKLDAVPSMPPRFCYSCGASLKA